MSFTDTTVKCVKAQHWIQLEMDGELSASRAAKLASHLASCDRCRRIREQLSAIRQAMRGTAGLTKEAQTLAPLPFAAPGRPVYRWTAAAVAALVIIGVGLSLIFSRLETSRPNPLAMNDLTVTSDRQDAGARPRDSSQLVHLDVSDPDDHLVVHMKTNNPRVSIYWVYPIIKTAEAQPRTGGATHSAM